MPQQWLYQVRGRLRDRLDPALARDLEGLVRNAGGGTNALVLPRSGHPLPRHMPYAFAEGIPDGLPVLGPGFGTRLSYDGSRFDGLTGAEIRDGELLLGLRAVGLEREVGLGLDGMSSGRAVTGLDALLDFISRVLSGPGGEVVGRILTDGHAFGHPLVRCLDGRVRIAHASGWREGAAPAALLPPVIPPWCVEGEDGWVADLDEDRLLRWFAGLRVEA